MHKFVTNTITWECAASVTKFKWVLFEISSDELCNEKKWHQKIFLKKTFFLCCVVMWFLFLTKTNIKLNKNINLDSTLPIPQNAQHLKCI